jgi:hypothetical protein
MCRITGKGPRKSRKCVADMTTDHQLQLDDAQTPPIYTRVHSVTQQLSCLPSPETAKQTFSLFSLPSQIILFVKEICLLK